MKKHEAMVRHATTLVVDNGVLACRLQWCRPGRANNEGGTGTSRCHVCFTVAKQSKVNGAPLLMYCE